MHRVKQDTTDGDATAVVRLEREVERGETLEVRRVEVRGGHVHERVMEKSMHTGTTDGGSWRSSK